MQKRIIIALFLSLVFFAPAARADIAPAPYPQASSPITEPQCAEDEKKVSCTIGSDAPAQDGCTQYSDDSSYRYLSESFDVKGRIQEYCTRLGDTEIALKGAISGYAVPAVVFASAGASFLLLRRLRKKAMIKQ
jgi:hypothetical protein